jgi:ADP-dependent NAD(P)H-hydrate dehydratase
LERAIQLDESAMNKMSKLQRVKSLPPPPARPEDANKGTFGRVLIVAGSRGMSGAACLSGLGSLRGGAGLVTIAAPAGIVPIIAAVESSYLTLPMPEDATGKISHAARAALESALPAQTTIAVGPGLGQSPALGGLVRWLFESVDRPGVFDADALNLLSAHPAALKSRARSTDAVPPRVLTPHPGEFARLISSEIATVEKNRESLAAQFAAEHKLILVLKGHRTLITDGARVALNSTGNSGMATGGAGDVLTGLIAALLAQKMAPFDAAQLGVHLHGLAGDLAAKSLSEPGLIASDLPRWLGLAWITFAKSARRSRK